MASCDFFLASALAMERVLAEPLGSFRVLLLLALFSLHPLPGLTEACRAPQGPCVLGQQMLVLTNETSWWLLWHTWLQPELLLLICHPELQPLKRVRDGAAAAAAAVAAPAHR